MEIKNMFFRKRQASLSRRLLQRVILLSLIAILGLVIIIAFSVWGILETKRVQLKTAGSTAVKTFDSFLLNIESDLLATSDSLATGNNLDKTFRRTLERQFAIFELALINPQGEILAQRRRIGQGELERVAEQPWLATVQAGKVYVGSVDFGEFGVPFVDLAVAVTDDAGNFSATLLARTDLTALWNTVTALRIGETGYVYITDEAGQLLAYRDLRLLEEGSRLEELVGYTAQTIAEPGLKNYSGVGGEHVVASGVPLESVPWFVVVEQPVSEALGPLAPGMIILLIALLVVGLLVYSIINFARYQLVRPLRLLREGVDVLGQGDLEHRINIQSKDEFGALATAFNTMTDSLRQRIQAEQVASEKATQLAKTEREAKEYLEKTVENYLVFVEQVATGDLTARLSLNGNDDTLTILGHNLNRMVERLGEMTTQIREATANITAAATEILAAAIQQTSGANEQSAAISQTSTTIDEVKTIVDQSFTKAQVVAEQAQRTNDISQAGQQGVTDTIEGMNQIKEKVAGIAENILALSEQTQQIGEITATVNEIASQSNLLALNASVEAARAGEHGKGFAVVAVEVRNLAEQSKQATAQVKGILNEIQRATNVAVMVTEEGAKGVDAGVQLTGQTGQTIQQLAGSITENAKAAQQIVASAQQQTSGIEQIALAMQNINQATVQNMASTRQAEKAAQNLSTVAQQMEALVARYKLS